VWRRGSRKPNAVGTLPTKTPHSCQHANASDGRSIPPGFKRGFGGFGNIMGLVIAGVITAAIAKWLGFV
jgi:hypothetical protein